MHWMLAKVMGRYFKLFFWFYEDRNLLDNNKQKMGNYIVRGFEYCLSNVYLQKDKRCRYRCLFFVSVINYKHQR